MADTCLKCGAQIEYAASSQSLKCPYCGTLNEIQRPEDALSNEVEKIVPLGVTQQDLELRVYEYMTDRGAYTPDDMLEAATIVLRERFYVPSFLFHVNYEATWTASFGYDRQEPFTAYREVHRNGHTIQEPYEEYRTVTNWSASNGIDRGEFIVSTYGGVKLADLNLSPSDLVSKSISKGSPTEFNSSFIKGFDLEPFAVPEKKAYSSLNDKIDSTIGSNVEDHNSQGDHQKDWHWKAKIDHSTTTVAIPLCHAIFDYEGKNYHVWVDGVDGSDIEADPLPVDKEKQQQVYLGFIPPIIGSVAFALSVYVWGFHSLASLVAVALAVGYPYLRRNALIGYSKTIRTSLLTQMKASSTVVHDVSGEDAANVAKAFQRPVRPLLARIREDKIVLPVLSAMALLGAAVPNYLGGSAAQQAAAGQAAQQAAAKQAAAEQAAAEQAAQQAAAEQAAQQAAAKQAAAEQAAAEQVASEQPATQGGDVSRDAAALNQTNKTLDDLLK